jgi:predicted O-linked N-acetylglucosamine transferase (SPINDLY family)
VNESIQNAMMLAQRGRFDDAVSSLRAILPTHGQNAEIHHTLGLLQFQLGALEQAAFHLDKARHLEPNRADIHSNYGTALNYLSRNEEAADAFRRSVEIDSRHFPGQLGLSSSLVGTRSFDEAAEAARAATTIQPNRPEGWVNLGLALSRSGRGGEAVKVLREALELMPGQPLLLTNLCYALHFRPDTDPKEVFEQHVNLGKSLTAAYGGGIRSFQNSTNPDRPLRIGYFSTDFRDGPIAPFIAPVVASHNRQQYRPFCYSATGATDRTTARLHDLVPDWRDVSRMSEAGAAQQIINDGIDILVDLRGPTPGSRIGVLVMRAAPVQATWLGYPGTTGLRSIGYRIVDAITDPDGADALSTEKLVRVDGGSFCYQPSPDAPEVSPPPSAAGGITFGSFNNAQKVVEPVIETWAAILRGLPGSRLILKAAAYSDEGTVQRTRAQFSGFGVSADRVEFLPHMDSPAAHLAAYSSIDIALDTFPYNGVATTCEALDMGVPVVTLKGASHAGRTAASLMSCAGIEGLTADSTESYIALATSLAGDRGKLASLRTGLRARLRNSALCDGQAFTRKLEAAYREMWRTWGNKVMYME